VKDFNFSIPYDIRIIELDHMKQISHASILSIFQEARIKYLENLGDFSELNIGDGCGLIQSEASLKIHNSVDYGNKLEVGVKANDIRGASFTLGYLITLDGAPMVEGETTLLSLDYASRKPKRLPGAFKDAMTKLESSTISEL
jgi:acyl-CoA thioesterase FadM